MVTAGSPVGNATFVGAGYITCAGVLLEYEVEYEVN
jgi:hypothetical protein